MDADRFDRLAKTCAARLPRRDALRRLGGFAAGSALAGRLEFGGPRGAEAKKKPKPRRCEPVLETTCPHPRPTGDCCDPLGETCTECGCCPNTSPKCCIRGRVRQCCPETFECCGVGNGTECCDPATQACTACGCCPTDEPKCCPGNPACWPADAECCGRGEVCFPSEGQSCCTYGRGKKKKVDCCEANERCDRDKGCVVPCKDLGVPCPVSPGKFACCDPLEEACTFASCGCCPNEAPACCEGSKGKTCCRGNGDNVCCDGECCAEGEKCCTTGLGSSCIPNDQCCPRECSSGALCCEDETCCDAGNCCREGTQCCPGGGCCHNEDTCCFRQSSQTLFCCPPGARCMQTGIPCCSNC